MTTASLQELGAELAPDQLSSDPTDLAIYALDWTRFYEPQASAVVFPKSIADVQTIVRWARKQRVALVPSGGRTGLSGGAVAHQGEVVVSFERMNQILDFNPIERTVTCQAGVVTEALQDYARAQGFFFPVDFAARGSSQIGGNIATNAGGIKVIRYGLMREWVVGLKVVTGQGELLELNGALVKNATGYDLRQLFIGSEGTLGFIVEAILKVTTPPPPTQVLVVGVPDLAAIMKIYQQFRRRVGVAAFEMFSEVALEQVLRQGHCSRPFAESTPYYLLIEAEVANEQEQEVVLEVFAECAEQNWIIDGVISQTAQQAREFWRLREDISESIAPYTPYKNDISVPISKVPEFISQLDQILRDKYPGFTVVWFGHIGDGNLHINILKPENLSKTEFLTLCHGVDTLVFDCVDQFAGSVSAEHGIGLLKKPYLSITRSAQEITILKGIKQLMDPDLILNPGKIFDLP